MSKTAELLIWIGKRIGKPPGWERIVRRFAGPERFRSIAEVCVVSEGLMFLAQPSIPVDWNVLFFGSYEPELREVFRAILRPGATAIDIGANVGYHTLLIAGIIGPNGRVLAAEPNASVRERLTRNVRLNRLSQVEIIPFAISGSDGNLEFFGPAANEAESGDGYVVSNMPAELRPANVVSIEARRLDSIVLSAQLDRVDLIKIDVEGFEWPVFQGAEETIARFRPHIVFEFNIEYTWRGHGSVDTLTEFFRKHNYRLYAIGQKWCEAVEPGKWPSCADIWAVPRDKKH